MIDLLVTAGPCSFPYFPVPLKGTGLFSPFVCLLSSWWQRTENPALQRHLHSRLPDSPKCQLGLHLGLYPVQHRPIQTRISTSSSSCTCVSHLHNWGADEQSCLCPQHAICGVQLRS